MRLSPATRYFLLGLGIIFVIAAVTFPDILQQQEMSAFDWLMRLRPARQVSPDIAVIAIDDSTIYDLGRWPLPRKHHALLIKALSEAGARLVVFDILLSEPSSSDELLAQEIKNCGRVILPAAFRIEEGSGSGSSVPAAQEILGAVTEQLKPAVKAVGHINIFVDSDGKVRRLPLNLRYADRGWPSLGLLAAADRLDIPAEKIRYPSNTFWINYPGPWKSFSPVSYSKILRAYEAGQKGLEPPLDLSMFRGKICFVGLTAVGTTDLRATPLESIYPMVGVHASVCDSFLQGKFLKRLNAWARSSITLAAALAAGAICLSLSPVYAGVSCVALVAALLPSPGYSYAPAEHSPTSSCRSCLLPPSTPPYYCINFSLKPKDARCWKRSWRSPLPSSAVSFRLTCASSGMSACARSSNPRNSLPVIFMISWCWTTPRWGSLSAT